jgi:replicative DNA helicase
MLNDCPPYKIEIEYYMIATLIMNPELLKKLPLKEDYFYHPNNLVAFQTLEAMTKNSEAISLVTFGNRFLDRGGKISEINALFRAEDYYSDLFAETYLRQLSEEFIKRKILEKYNSLKDAPKEFVEAIKKLEMDFIENRPKNIGELYNEYVEDYKKRKTKQSVGLVTGYNVIDKNCAFEQGELIILAAKTSVGKTSLALNIAISVAMFGQKVLFFSAEMKTRELLNRVFSQLTGTDSTLFKYANADNALTVAKQEIEPCKSNLIFVEAMGMTGEEVARTARKEKAVDLIVVDYIQYLKDKVEKGGTNNDRIGLITRTLKGLAGELNCSVLALSQVNRATVGVPELHNLRDSGNIEQDSDTVLILHREGKDSVVANFVIAKNRNGQTSKTTLKFNPKLTKFSE